MEFIRQIKGENPLSTYNAVGRTTTITHTTIGKSMAARESTVYTGKLPDGFALACRSRTFNTTVFRNKFSGL